MRVRDVAQKDLPRLRELFEQQGFEYELPDFADKDFLAKQAVVDDADRVVMMVAARRTVELYMLVDKDWETPGWRMQAFALLHAAMRKVLIRLGIADAHCWLPPAIAKSFGRRLMRQFGWSKPVWTDFWRETRN